MPFGQSLPRFREALQPNQRHRVAESCGGGARIARNHPGVVRQRRIGPSGPLQQLGELKARFDVARVVPDGGRESFDRLRLTSGRREHHAETELRRRIARTRRAASWNCSNAACPSPDSERAVPSR